VDEFIALLGKRSKRRPKARTQRPQAEPKLAKAEVEAWLELFEGRTGE